MIRKNKKFIDPRYFMDEKLEVTKEIEQVNELFGFGKKKSEPAPELSCEEVRERWNELAPQTSYGFAGDQAMMAQERLLNDPRRRKCFSSDELEELSQHPSQTVDV